MDTLLGMSITLLCFSVGAGMIYSLDSLADDEYKRAIGWTTVVLFTISMLFFLTHQHKELRKVESCKVVAVPGYVVEFYKGE